MVKPSLFRSWPNARAELALDQPAFGEAAIERDLRSELFHTTRTCSHGVVEQADS